MMTPDGGRLLSPVFDIAVQRSRQAESVCAQATHPDEGKHATLTEGVNITQDSGHSPKIFSEERVQWYHVQHQIPFRFL